MRLFQCTICKHRIDSEATAHKCLAFPNGIPRELDVPRIVHTNIVKGQVGDYTFERDMSGFLK